MPKLLSQKIKKIEAKEKKGSYGAWRKAFCEKYSELLIRTRNNAYHSLLETLDLKNDLITCRTGCTHCCFHYVAVSLAHGIVIADFLYKRKELLKLFVHNYEEWHREGYALADGIDRRRHQSMSSSASIDRVIADTRPLSERYRDKRIACPFLSDDRCFIYDVRPLSCSGHYSVSPPEWCAPAPEKEPTIHHAIPRDEDLVEMIRIADSRLVFFELSLPIMMNKLLNAGVAAVMHEM